MRCEPSHLLKYVEIGLDPGLKSYLDINTTDDDGIDRDWGGGSIVTMYREILIDSWHFLCGGPAFGLLTSENNWIVIVSVILIARQFWIMVSFMCAPLSQRCGSILSTNTGQPGAPVLSSCP